MSQLRIRLLGALELREDDTLLPSFPTQRSASLFAYLLIHRGRLCPRHVVMGALWGDRPEDEARKSLRTALWRMRSIVEPEDVEAGTYIRIRADQVGFNWDSDYWLDVEQLEAAVRDARNATGGDTATVEALSVAVDLYDGPLLDGVYDEWALSEAERVKAIFLHGVEDLVSLHMARREWDAALRRGCQLLQYDPLREHVHRDVMRCHYAMGNRPGALQQYASCSEALEEELGVEPMHETRELYRAVLDGSADREPSSEVGARGPDAGERVRDPGSVADGLEQAARDLEDVTARIRRGLRALGRQGQGHRPGKPGHNPRTPA